MTKAEKEKKRLSKLNVERVRRYYEKNPGKHFDIIVDMETYSKIDTRLKQDGVTKKEFVLKSFEQYEKNNGFQDDEN